MTQEQIEIATILSYMSNEEKIKVRARYSELQRKGWGDADAIRQAIKDATK